MITIAIKYHQNSQALAELIISGHSLKTTADVEPACACVSNIILGLINFFQQPSQAKIRPQFTIKPGLITMQFQPTVAIQPLTDLIIIQLTMAAKYFSSKIKLHISK